MQKSRADRRTFLGIAGATIAAAIAGCTDEEEEGEGDVEEGEEDVEEVDVDKLKEMVHVKDEDIRALDKYVAKEGAHK